MSRYLKELDMLTKAITPDALHAEVQRCYGFSIQEDASAAAVIELRELSATGQAVTYLNLAADETANFVLPKGVWLEFPGGCWVKEVSGSVTGVLYY
jgi:hypothetical protein